MKTCSCRLLICLARSGRGSAQPRGTRRFSRHEPSWACFSHSRARKAVRRAELMELGYFVYLFVPILRARISRGSRARVLTCAAATVLSVVAVSRFRSAALEPIRDWAPCLFLVAGYWLPGRLFTTPDVRLEQRLLAIDA